MCRTNVEIVFYDKAMFFDKPHTHFVRAGFDRHIAMFHDTSAYLPSSKSRKKNMSTSPQNESHGHATT